MSKPGKAIEIFRTEGAGVALEYLASYFEFRLLGGRAPSLDDICYRRWLQRTAASDLPPEEMKRQAAALAYRPLISVIVPAYNTDPTLLRQAVQSVEAQAYREWELCIADDCSTRAETRAELDSLAGRDGAVKVRRLEKNVGIAAASNAALELAEGEFIALLDHDDRLAPDALFEMVKLLNERPDTDMVYSDEDKLDERGRRVEAFMKPDWSPELLLSNMYTCHLGVYRKSVIDEIGGFREGFDGAQDYDLALRLTERTRKIEHIPKVLYHWRRVEGSTSVEYSTSAAGKAPTAASIKALEQALERRDLGGKVELGLFPGSFRARPEIPADASVSIIIPTRDALTHLQRCIESIERHTPGIDYEIIVVDNRSSEKETFEYLSAISGNERCSVVRYDDEFNFSAMNNMAADAASGDYLLFLNNDTEAIEPGWMEAMLEPLQIPGVAVVGAKLLYPDDTAQHAGVTLWHCGTAGHTHSGLPRNEHGYFGAASGIRNCSAVSAACMMVRKDFFLRRMNGFDTSLGVSYQDVDFCLRALEAGLRVVYTPFALLYHHESASTGKRANEKEERLFIEKWVEKMPVDKYYSVNFPNDRLDFRLKAR